jgi:cytoskeletal protein CcmA (bactofilin family)
MRENASAIRFCGGSPMFSTWKTDTTSFDPAPRAQPQPEPAATTPIRPATAGTVMAAHGKDTFSVINEWLKMKGDLEGDGDILVKGTVHGNIRCKMLIVDVGANVEGGIEADDVVIRGTARGVIRTKRIRLEKSALVDAEIYHESFSAEEGARVKGMMHTQVASSSPATTTVTTYTPKPSPPTQPKENEPKGLAAALRAAATNKTPATPEAKVSSALYDMLDVARMPRTAG